MKLTFVVAVSRNGVIGSHNALPWYIPEDLKHFKDVTKGKTVLMGRNTFDSIINRIGKPLPERTNVVVSRQPEFKAPGGVVVYPSIEEALEGLKDVDEVMVAGGGQIYSQLIDKADKLLITEVHKEIDGDVMFPPVDPLMWQKVSSDDHGEFTWVEYVRKK
ncbi:MAG: dihydrofolate reductase [Candidatus Doudnabacteria bacterium]|nr:dihydrofolate reductase [bacterium]MDZ4244085.1 dihydrofolate reductase [Candidatus Doudnabacteria bacterium]